MLCASARASCNLVVSLSSRMFRSPEIQSDSEIRPKPLVFKEKLSKTLNDAVSKWPVGRDLIKGKPKIGSLSRGNRSPAREAGNAQCQRTQHVQGSMQKRPQIIPTLQHQHRFGREGRESGQATEETGDDEQAPF